MAVPLIIAHRGDSAARPENTLSAFRQALAVSADMIELDVQLTRDGHVVVLHDATVNRTTDGTGNVREMTLADIKKLDASFPTKFGTQFKGERVPTLAEALEVVRGKAKGVLVEIKRESVTNDEKDGIEARTIAEIARLRVEKEVALISFERRALARCRTLAPEIRRGHIFYREELPAVVTALQEIESDIIMPEKGMLSDDLRDLARDADVKIATWVVDEPAELRALAHFDLFAVGSNRPGVLLDALWSGD
jgi:glycerophosphoryl diester phosphodiesterase